LSSSVLATIGTGLAYSRVTQTFNGTVILKNISASPMTGAFEVVFNGVPAGVTLVNATGSLAGSPYITVASTTIAPGASITVAVQFKNPSNVMIQATPVVYMGSI